MQAFCDRKILVKGNYILYHEDMSSKTEKSQYSSQVLKALSESKPLAVEALKKNKDPKTGYALTRSIKNLAESGCIDLLESDNKSYIKLTKKGKTKLNSIRLLGEEALVAQTWDGFWRVIILDIPEDRKNERESLRYLLKKANFVCVKNTVWISPHPYEHLFVNIKKDLSLGTELMIIVTDKLDKETHLAFLGAIKK